MSFLINTPPTLDGDNAAKILQLYKHLYKMSEEVNYALNALAEGNVVDLTGTTQARQIFATAMTGGAIGGTDAPSLQSYNELKSLIIKTGNAIENSKASIATNASDILDNKTEISGLKEINMELSNAFGVGSEYGSYAEAISNKMSLSAEGVVQKYELVSKLEAADAKAAEFAEWINLTDEYIKTGFLYTDENGTRRVGVAIGTNITTSIVDGVVQPNATKTDLLATFVSDALIFWQGGEKVAYLSNKKLYILSAEFLGSYRIGKFQWVYTDDLGLVLEFLN